MSCCARPNRGAKVGAILMEADGTEYAYGVDAPPRDGGAVPEWFTRDMAAAVYDCVSADYHGRPDAELRKRADAALRAFTRMKTNSKKSVVGNPAERSARSSFSSDSAQEDDKHGYYQSRQLANRTALAEDAAKNLSLEEMLILREDLRVTKAEVQSLRAQAEASAQNLMKHSVALDIVTHIAMRLEKGLLELKKDTGAIRIDTGAIRTVVERESNKARVCIFDVFTTWGAASYGLVKQTVTDGADAVARARAGEWDRAMMKAMYCMLDALQVAGLVYAAVYGSIVKWTLFISSIAGVVYGSKKEKALSLVVGCLLGATYWESGVIMFEQYHKYRKGGGAPLYELVSGDNPVEAIAERTVFATVYAGETYILPLAGEKVLSEMAEVRDTWKPYTEKWMLKAKADWFNTVVGAFELTGKAPFPLNYIQPPKEDMVRYRNSATEFTAQHDALKKQIHENFEAKLYQIRNETAVLEARNAAAAEREAAERKLEMQEAAFKDTLAMFSEFYPGELDPQQASLLRLRSDQIVSDRISRGDYLTTSSTLVDMINTAKGAFTVLAIVAVCSIRNKVLSWSRSKSKDKAVEQQMQLDQDEMNVLKLREPVLPKPIQEKTASVTSRKSTKARNYSMSAEEWQALNEAADEDDLTG